MSESAQTGGGSRPSKTNPADPPDGQYGPSSAESLRTVLTEQDDVSLRKEVIDGDQPGMQPVAWRDAVWEWREWYKDSKDSSAVLENDVGETVKVGDPNRFHPDYGDKQYAKLKDLERGLKAEYGKRLHTAMVSLSASSTDEDGNPLPPVDHLLELLESTEAVMRALRRVLEGRRYEYLVILEPHKSGYLHIHIGVFVDGVIRAVDFEPVIEAHLRNCDLAGEDAHEIVPDQPNESAVSVNHTGGDRDDGSIENLASYLSEYIGVYGEEPLEQAEHVQMANAILWATGKRRWRPSQPDYVECSGCGTKHHPEAECHECGSTDTEPLPENYSRGASYYMATNRGVPDPSWELVGIEDGDGELHEIEGDVSGGVTKLDTYIPGRPPPD